MTVYYKITHDFEERHSKFVEALDYVNDKYGNFFDCKEGETGNIDRIEMHINVNIDRVRGRVRISFYPKSYLPELIKNDTIKLFGDYFAG